jgi:hypothetical protein
METGRMGRIKNAKRGKSASSATLDFGANSLSVPPVFPFHPLTANRQRRVKKPTKEVGMK